MKIQNDHIDKLFSIEKDLDSYIDLKTAKK